MVGIQGTLGETQVKLKQMKNELKEAGKSGRQVLREAAQLAGATIKGDVHALAMLRADHGVDRRMSASKWANPDQKTILLEQAYDELKAICTKFQDESGATDLEVKTLLRELARVYEKDIDDNYDIDWEV